jgi:serine phosphatase RsbU (regulator of sigma subunit)
VLRALAIDRQELPGQVEEHHGAWRALVANAGHPPPLQITGQDARYLDSPPELLLGAGVDAPRSTVTVALPPGSTLLFYTDGLIERRDRSLEHTLAEVREAAVALVDLPLEQLCDKLLSRFAATPSDDVCLLALRTPGKS